MGTYNELKYQCVKYEVGVFVFQWWWYFSTFILQFKISNMDNVYLILNWFHSKYLDDTLPSLNIYLKYRRIINTKRT